MNGECTAVCQVGRLKASSHMQAYLLHARTANAASIAHGHCVNGIRKRIHCLVQIVKDWEAEEDDWWDEDPIWSGSSESRYGSGSKYSSGSGGSSSRAGAKPTKSALKSWWGSNTQASTAQKSSAAAERQRDLEDSWSRWKAEDEQRQQQMQENAASRHWKSAR